MPKTAAFIEETHAARGKSAEQPKAQPKNGRGQHPNSRKNLVAPWTPGTVANPTGKNQWDDMGKEIARAVLENNPVAVYNAMTKLLLKGNAYGFQVLCDRAYGKLKEQREVTHKYASMSEQDIDATITDCLRSLDLAAEIDAVGIAARKRAAKSKAKD